jgi:hypothetical protein
MTEKKFTHRLSPIAYRPYPESNLAPDQDGRCHGPSLTQNPKLKTQNFCLLPSRRSPFPFLLQPKTQNPKPKTSAFFPLTNSLDPATFFFFDLTP